MQPVTKIFTIMGNGPASGNEAINYFDHKREILGSLGAWLTVLTFFHYISGDPSAKKCLLLAAILVLFFGAGFILAASSDKSISRKNLKRYYIFFVAAQAALLIRPIYAQLAPAGNAPNLPAQSVDGNWRTNGVFAFKIQKCTAIKNEVKISLLVKVNDANDHTLFVASQRHGDIPDMSLAPLGLCEIIDSEGKTESASAVQLANKAGAIKGQSDFIIYAETQPTMVLTFDGVSIATSSVRLQLATGERVGRSVRSLPMEFKSLKIERTEGK